MTSELEIRKLIDDYYRAFSTLDPAVFLPYFTQPAMVVGPPGVFAAPEHHQLAAMVAPTIAKLRAEAYERSEFQFEELKPLGASAALVTGIAARFKTGGGELERVTLSYLVHKSADGWRIAGIVFH